MSGLTIYRLRLLCALLVILLAAALQLFWKVPYKTEVAAVLGIAGTAMATTKLPQGTKVDPTKRIVSSNTANIAVVVIMFVGGIIWVLMTRRS